MTNDDLKIPRVRFNWGFHDGTQDAKQKWNRSVDDHFDAIYTAGFLAGRASYQASAVRESSSDRAWAEYEAARAANPAQTRAFKVYWRGRYIGRADVASADEAVQQYAEERRDLDAARMYAVAE